MLALFLLFSETATAFAGEVSNNGAVPFEYVEEGNDVASENSETLISENESQEEVVESEENEFNDSETKIVAMELISEPTEDRYYAYFSNISKASSPYGLKFKVTYENGKSEELGYRDLYDSTRFLNYGLLDSENKYVKGDSTNGIFTGYSAGTYRRKYAVKDNTSISISFDVTIKPWESIPMLELDNTVSMNATNEQYVNDQGKTVSNMYGYAVYSMNLEEGDYKITSSKQFYAYKLYDSKGKEVSGSGIELLRSSLEQYFSVSSGTYYIVLCSTEDTEITLSKDNRPKSIEVVSEPEKNTFVYGIESPSLWGLKAKIKYADGTESKEYMVSSVESLGVFTSYAFNENGTYAQYVNGRLAPGKYYYKVFPNANTSLYKIYNFTVKELNAPTVSVGQMVSLKKNAGKYPKDDGFYYTIYDEEGNPYDPFFYSISLIENEKYCLNFETDYYNCAIYDSDYKYVDTINGAYNKIAEYIPTKTGTHYLKINSLGGKFCVATPETITEVTILSPQRQCATYAGTRYGAGADSIYLWPTGIRVRVAYANGDSFECAADDDAWKAAGIGIEWLYDVSGNSIGEVKYVEDRGTHTKVYELKENEDYYLKLKVPGFSGEVTGAELLKIKALPIEELTLTKGKKYILPLDNNGHISGSKEYYADVKAGNIYRFKSSPGSKIDLYDSGNFVASNTYISKENGYIYKAEKDGRLYFDVLNEFMKETDYSSEAPWIMYEEAEAPSRIVVSKAPGKLSYMYGINDPYPDGVQITLKYESIDYETTVSIKDFTKNSILWKLYKEEGVKAERDENGNYPVGTYYYGYNVGSVMLYDKDHPVTIEEASKDYSVVFNSNLNETGLPDKTVTQTIATNTFAALKGNTFEYKGHKFDGWALSPDGEVKYADKESVKNIAGEKESVTLYAHWSLVDYKIRWHLGGASFKDEDLIPATYTMENEIIAIPPDDAIVLEDTHFVFIGWYSDPSYNTVASPILKGSTGERDFYAKIVPEVFTIHFEGNGATSGSMTDKTVNYGVDEKLPANGFKNSKAFLGWALTPGGEKVIDDKQTVNVKEYIDKVVGKTLTLYALWEDTFTITYYDEDVVVDSQPYVYGTKPSLRAGANKPGKAFVGWYKKNGTKVKSLTKKTYGNIELYARYTAAKYTVKFNANGGKGKMKDLPVYCDKAVNLSRNTFTRKGYEFKGWVLAASASEAKELANEAAFEAFKANHTIYDDGFDTTVNLGLVINDKDKVNLAAVWMKKQYTVTVVCNGGSPVAAIEPYEYKGDKTESFVLPAAPTREGYTFKGWYKDPLFKKQIKNTKGLWEDITLYAKWSISYKVHFDKNAEDATGTMNDQTLTLNKSTALSNNKFSRAGYAFCGWTDDPASETVVYKNKQKINGDNDKTVINLYAVWKKEFKITYVTNGGIIESESPLSYIYKEGTTLKKAVRPGYTFAGWYSDTKLKKKATSVSKTATGDLTFYAKWKGVSYKVTFDANAPEGTSVTGKTKDVNLTYGVAKAITKNGYKIKGYTFKGWATRKDGGVVYKDGAKFADYENAASSIVNIGPYKSPLNLFAVWEKDSYTVTYKMGGVLHDKVVTDAYTVDSGYTLEEPSRLGYTFLGFYTDKKCKKKAKDLAPGTTGNKTFYAKWKANK